MFSTPDRLEASVHASMPPSFHVTDRASTWVDVQARGAATPTFLEGPAFDSAGRLWVVDIPWGRLFRFDPDGQAELMIEYGGEPNGLKFYPDGRGFIADHRHGIMVFDPVHLRVAPFLDRAWAQRFKGTNDLCFASSGDLYFTDQGQTGQQDPSGCLYRLRANGQLDCLLDNVPSPNGLVLNAAEDTIFLAVTRANAVWRVPLLKDGRATKVGVFIQLSGGIGPDGLAMDRHGNLAVCHPGLGAVWLFNRYGEPVLRIDSPDGRLTTNCVFSADGRRLFITESETGTVLVADLPSLP